MDTVNNDKITTWCWLTGSFLLYFEQQKRGSGSKLYSDFLSALNTNPKIDSFNFFNQGTLLMLCYGLLVYPWEFWKNNIDFKKLNTYIVKAANNHPGEKIEIDDITELFKFANSNEINAKCLLKHLRNSISHSKVKIDILQNKFTFNDINPRTKEEFSAEISMKNLGVFLTGVGKYFCNELDSKN